MANTSSTSLKTLLRASWDATTGQRPRFFCFVTLFVMAYTFDLIVPWAIGYTLGVFVEKGFTDEAYNGALYGIGAYMALRLAYTICHHVARYIQNTVAYSARMYTLNKVFGSLLKFPLNWHIGAHSGDNLSKLHRSAAAIESCIATYVWQVIEGLVKVIFASIAIFALDFWVAVNVLSMGVFTVVLMIFFNQRLTDRWRKNNLFNNKISRICVDYLYNVVTVKTLGLERAATEYLLEQRDEGLVYSRKISKYNELKWGSTALGYGIVIGSSLLIYFHGHRNLHQAFDVAQVYVLLNYLDKIFQAIGSFTGYYSGVVEAATAYEDGNSILEKALTAPLPATSSRIQSSWKKISVHKLNFSYILGEAGGLRDLSIDIGRRDKVALVGPTGGGKSTLLKLIGGVLKSESGWVSTEGQPELLMEDLNALSLLIPQEPEIFSESLRYNLTMGEEFSEKDIERYMELGRADNVVAKLPLGMETNLAEKGLNLSVGEKQRVALVRGLLRAPRRDILLLDEPTSSLDPSTEKAIFFGLLEHFSEKVIITACHRLNLVPLFDKVIFVRDGNIEEMGSFPELLERGGAFAQAWADYERKVPPAHEQERREVG